MRGALPDSARRFFGNRSVACARKEKRRCINTAPHGKTG